MKLVVSLSYCNSVPEWDGRFKPFTLSHCYWDYKSSQWVPNRVRYGRNVH